MFEVVSVLVAVAGVYIAYLTLQHQKKSTSLGSSHARSPASAHTSDNVDASQQTDNKRTVPDGIVLGDKVVLVPGLQMRLFTHSGRIEEDVLRGKQYSWISRGDVIGRYHMDIAKSNADYWRHVMGSEHRSVDIHAPVSGLIVNTRFEPFVHWPKRTDPQVETPTVPPLSILIADDEPAPESNTFMYRSALRFIDEHKAPLFRPSRQWTMEGMTDEDFARLVGYQQQAECLIVDAMPEYAAFFEEARTRFPELRPHIKHLL
ncbi:hypothetical protein BC777_0125 [Yoonia maricola]|uniref:Uncharacterized protein n=1 Tax=Yoonia maricola TaxID=420999 RepID=A0A2M8WK44_9RHOB|nr:hypothetical protein [Yoonia maricola]PJI91300.1 hypothetical protein BC777_0125 [Yoonia maricola]